MTIEELYERVEKGWSCSKDNYPAYPSGSEDQVIYDLHHTQDHVLIALGKISTLLESHAHGEALDREQLKQNVKPLLLGAIKTAIILDMSPNEITEMIHDWANKHIKN